MDNGFFEKFGTELLYKEQGKISSSSPQDADSGVGEEITATVSVEDLDSDHEDANKDLFISDAFGWNVSD